MKAGIVGAGAIGSLFTWYFHTAGIDTVIYEKSEETAAAVSQGLKIITAEGESVIKPMISHEPSILGDADIIFIFVKSYSTAEACETVSRFIKNDRIIVSLQNGLGNNDTLGKFFPLSGIVYGTTTFGAAKTSPTDVVFGGRGTVSIGGSSGEAVQKVKALLLSAGIDVYMSDNPERIVWMKALVNAGINPVASILGIKNGAILENSSALLLQESIIAEAVAAANARGIVFDYETVLSETRSICHRTAANTCSMLQDLRAGRKTEIETINMKIAEYGEAAGIDMKCNRTVSLLVKAMEERNTQI